MTATWQLDEVPFDLKDEPEAIKGDEDRSDEIAIENRVLVYDTGDETHDAYRARELVARAMFFECVRRHRLSQRTR